MTFGLYMFFALIAPAVVIVAIVDWGSARGMRGCRDGIGRHSSCHRDEPCKVVDLPRAVAIRLPAVVQRIQPTVTERSQPKADPAKPPPTSAPGDLDRCMH